MNITKVQIHVNHSQKDSIKAWADIIFEDEFIVKGLQIRQDHQGCHFVTMPFRLKSQGPNDKVRQDIAHPIKDSCRRLIETTVLDAYEDTLSKMAMNNQEKENPNPYITK